MLLSRRLFTGIAVASAIGVWPLSRLLSQDLALPSGLDALAGPPPRDPPSARRQISVADPDELKAALAAARPGDDLILKPGTYAGDFRALASGTAEEPIVVRAERQRGTIIIGGITLDHDHVWLHGLELALNDRFMPITGDANCITSCLIGGRYGLQIREGGSFNRIGFNRFAIEAGEGNDVQIRLRREEIGRKTAYGNHIYRNYFVAGAINQVRRKQAGSSLYINTWRIDNYPDIGTLIEYNYFEHLERRSAVRVKSNGNIIRYNTVIGSGENTKDDGSVNFLNRNGRRNLWLANISDGARGIIAFHSDNRYIANHCERGAKIDVMAGINGNKGEDSVHPPCENCLFVANEGPMRVGYQYFNGKNLLPARGNVVEAQRPDDYSIEILANQEDTQIHERTSRAVTVEARRLSPREVGPDAT